MNSMTRKTLTLPALLCAGIALADDGDCSLDVRITGLEHDNGQIMVSLFNQAEGFPGKGQEAAMETLTTTPENGEAAVRFESLPCGEYAIAAHHDEDGDGKMKTVYGTIPLEGVGISNDAKGVMGPPKFEDAKFDLAPESGQVEIIVRY